ncbi:hypothetical protein BD309DRAFT_1023505 [Dichomitus squalens]|nr:hypothetical protein BD309DRAFT_1023505 [Dichomitus squalens]
MTARVVDELWRGGYNVRIIVRATERDISSTVVPGLREAQGDNVLRMGADLQEHIAPLNVFAMLASMSPTKRFALAAPFAKRRD